MKEWLDPLKEDEPVIKQFDTKSDLVFWFDAPPRAGAGAFRAAAQLWPGDVYYLCMKPIRAERKAGGWVDCNHGKAQVIILSEQPDPECFVKDFVQQRPDTIHVCNGLRSLTSIYTKKYLLSDPDAKIVLWSERPSFYGNALKKILIRLLHTYLAFRYSNKAEAYLALGTIGVKSFAGMGWDSNILYPFMYDPLVTDNLAETSSGRSDSSEQLRLVYVGRFARSTKGIDVLMKAVEGLVGDRCCLDLIGGYGEYREQTIAWAEKHKNVKFLGTWPSSEISQRLSSYDVCIVPSRYDGWNVVTNEAIRAGIGVIVTDGAASDDLVRVSGAGEVVRAGDVRALRTAIQKVIDTPELAELWKEKARAYAPRISSETVGRYLVDILNYSFSCPKSKRPECPWL